MQAPGAAQKSQRAQTALSGSISVCAPSVTAGGTRPASARSEQPAAGLPKGPDGNHGDNLETTITRQLRRDVMRQWVEAVFEAQSAKRAYSFHRCFA